MLLGKKDYVSKMAEHYDMTKVEATAQYENVFEMLGILLSEGNDVSVPDIGKFSIKERAEREGRNPITGEAIVIPAKKAVTFKVSKVLKDAVAVL